MSGFYFLLIRKDWHAGPNSSPKLSHQSAIATPWDTDSAGGLNDVRDCSNMVPLGRGAHREEEPTARPMRPQIGFQWPHVHD